MQDLAQAIPITEEVLQVVETSCIWQEGIAVDSSDPGALCGYCGSMALRVRPSIREKLERALTPCFLAFLPAAHPKAAATPERGPSYTCG